MLLSHTDQQRPARIHPRAALHPHAQLSLPSDSQADDQQRGVSEPRDPVAEAVSEERLQQGEKIQTRELREPLSRGFGPTTKTYGRKQHLSPLKERLLALLAPSVLTTSLLQRQAEDIILARSRFRS